MSQVNKYIAQIKIDDALDKFIDSLTVDNSTLLMELILKNLELIAEGSATVSSTLMLKLHTRLMEKRGPSVQLRAISKRHPL